MMVTTHIFVGALLGSLTAFVAPEYVLYATVVGAMGGGFPDLDLVFYHRKTFHYPLYFSAVAAIAGLLTILIPATATVLIAFFLIGAAAHSLMDVFGGDLGMRPWERNDDRGVYDHYRGKWVAPRRWVPYDGSPQDVVLLSVLALPLLYVHDGVLDHLVLIGVVGSFLYMLVRKKLPDIDERLGHPLPAISGS